MNVQVSINDSNRYELSVISSGSKLFCSTDDIFPFVGRYSDYSNVKSALSAYARLIYLNGDILTAQQSREEEGEKQDSIKSGFVEKYQKRIKFFLDMIDRIEETKNKGDLKKRVNNLKQMVDQLSVLVDKTAVEFENSERPVPIPVDQTIKEIGEEKLLDPYAKDLMLIKKKIDLFHRRLKKHFGNYIESYSHEFLKCSSDENIWKISVICDFIDEICKCIKLSDSYIDRVEEKEDGFESEIKCNNGSIIVYFNDCLIFNRLIPTGNLLIEYPVMSQAYYNSLLKPAIRAVGHFLYNDQYILVPEQPELPESEIGYSTDSEYVKDIYSGFDIRDNSSIVAKVVLNGKGINRVKTCDLKIAARRGREQGIIDKLACAENMLRASKMVKCFGTGTKYDGIAGVADIAQLIKRDGYYDVPVTFEFDNGLKEKVVISSDNLEKYI